MTYVNDVVSVYNTMYPVDGDLTAVEWRVRNVFDRCVYVYVQNVLIQIGLHVLSVNGMLIKQARNYILRCHACFK